MIDPLSLGATLYLPATRPRLAQTLLDGAVPGLRSAVVCLEDAVREADLPDAFANVAALLQAMRARSTPFPAIFLRPRDPAMLARLLALPGIEAAAGFVVPKVTLERLAAFLRPIEGSAHLLMPTLETADVFEPDGIRRLRDGFCAARERILAVRIGGNDLLQILGARRSTRRTLYEGPLGPTVAALVTALRPHGFVLTAPVFEHFSRPALLRDEVERDLEFGLCSKTAIHPMQVATIQACYAVSGAELEAARALLDETRPAVFGSAGAMAEPATHAAWAATILARSRHFGVRGDAGAALDPRAMSA